jgi:peroxiredoxin-like protein
LQVVLEERAVQNFPHRYAVRAAGTAEDVVVELASNGLTAVSTASPAEFGGPGDRWSPETLLVGAVADCFVLTFRAVAKASKLPWQLLACDAVGTLDRIEGVVRFTAIDLRARLVVAPGADAALAHRALEKAERGCLISNSLKADTHLEIAIEIAVRPALAGVS